MIIDTAISYFLIQNLQKETVSAEEQPTAKDGGTAGKETKKKLMHELFFDTPKDGKKEEAVAAPAVSAPAVSAPAVAAQREDVYNDKLPFPN